MKTGLRWLGGYLWARRGRLVLLAVCCGIFAVVLTLYGEKGEPVLYAGALCAVVLATDGALRTWLIVVAALAAVAIGWYIEKTLRGHKYHPPVDPNLDGVEEQHDVFHHKEKHDGEA